MNSLLNSALIAVLFAILKTVHVKYVLKEKIVPKPIIVDSILVFVASVITIYNIQQFNLDEITTNTKNLQAFVNSPDF